jgi:hypothetical protein
MTPRITLRPLAQCFTLADDVARRSNNERVSKPLDVSRFPHQEASTRTACPAIERGFSVSRSRLIILNLINQNQRGVMGDMSNTQAKSGRGGRRPGAGRPRRDAIRPTVLTTAELREAKAADVPLEIDVAARTDALETIERLEQILTYGSSEPAIVAAACEILDRGYSKPAVAIGGDPLLPFMTRPPMPSTIRDTARAKAQALAPLALMTLRKLRDSARTETSRVAAARALLARGLGTAAMARLVDESSAPKLGKKEQALIDAQAPDTGTTLGELMAKRAAMPGGFSN